MGRRHENKPVYIFDLEGNLSMTFDNTKQFKESKFYLRWINYSEPTHTRFSTNSDQHCIYSRFYITRTHDFKVNLLSNKSNHNPLRKYISQKRFITELQGLLRVRGFTAINEAGAPVEGYYLLNFELMHEFFLKENYRDLAITFEPHNDPGEANYFEKHFINQRKIKDLYEWQ
jgi:hypothetical protein